MAKNKLQLTKECENELKNHKKSCSNSIRILHLKVSNIIEYRSSFHINAYIDTMIISIDALKDVPMTPETEIGDFSREDGQNVSIPSVLEPLLHEIWPRFVDSITSTITRVLRYDDFGQILLDMVKAESGRRWQEIEKKVKNLEAEKFINIDFTTLKNRFEEVKDILVQYLKFGDVVYAEYVGVNMSLFLKRLAEKTPKFLEYNDRYESNLKLKIRLFLLASDLESLNSLKMASNYVSVIKLLDQTEELRVAKYIIESKITQASAQNERHLKNLATDEQTVIESEIENLKMLLK